MDSSTAEASSSKDKFGRVLDGQVRILAGDTENDYNAKFPPGPLFAETVCSCIADKQGIPAEGRKMFALWIVGRDIEIQIKPRTNIFQLVTNWNKIVVKYTHFPQALDPAHLVNRYWFIYRREATLSKAEEMRYNGNESIVNLFYGEAKRNVLSGRYTCTPDDASILGALQIQINLGNFDPLRRPPGYISKNMRFLENIIPSRMISLKKPQEWEKCISEQHIRLKGTSVFLARIAYLNMVRQWRCYGCSFFPVCHDPPPAGFF
ncbi:FERM central domain-containing protein [Chytridium lagenaria]|nr:FERM central domain-containing protein [Chytridium lagenaria]